MDSISKCIILDLDQTLLFTDDGGMKSFYKLKLNESPRYVNILSRCYYFELEDYGEPGKGTLHPMWGIKRPHLEEFLKFCFDYFELVIVWSAGQPDYVEKVVRKIFNNSKFPHIVLNSTDVDIINGNPLKSIPKLMKIIDERYPYYSGKLNIKNALAVDDIATNFEDNPRNGILIPEYVPELTHDGLNKDDTRLLQIMDWLLLAHVQQSEDVRYLDKSIIFHAKK